MQQAVVIVHGRTVCMLQRLVESTHGSNQIADDPRNAGRERRALCPQHPMGRDRGALPPETPRIRETKHTNMLYEHQQSSSSRNIRLSGNLSWSTSLLTSWRTRPDGRVKSEPRREWYEVHPAVRVNRSGAVVRGQRRVGNYCCQVKVEITKSAKSVPVVCVCVCDFPLSLSHLMEARNCCVRSGSGVSRFPKPRARNS